jgi:hypothetical protein
MTQLRKVDVRDGNGNPTAVVPGTDVLKIGVFDGFGNPIGSLHGALDIHDADVHREIINKQLKQDTATTTTFSVAASAGDTQINLTSAAGFAVNDYLHISNATGEENVLHKITALAGTVATLDMPIDRDYAIGDSITKSLVNMAVTGSLASPLSFKVEPRSGDVWHLYRILIEMTHTTAGDNGLFGNLPELTNGCVLRRYDGTTGTYNTYTNWKANGDLVTDMYDVVYAARSGGGGAYGTNGRGTFKNTGSIVYLDGTAGDYAELLIQDDLSSLTSFRIKAQGHFED